MLALEPGDLLMLASDGILTLTDDEIVSLCTEPADQRADSIVQTGVDRVDAAERPNQDNATFVVVRHDVTRCDQGDSAVPARSCESQAQEPQVQGAPVLAQDVVNEDDIGIADASAVARRSESWSGVKPLWSPVGAKPGALLLWLTSAFVLGVLCGAVGRHFF